MKQYLFFVTFFLTTVLFGQQAGESISYRHYKSRSLDTPINFAVKGTLQELLAAESVHYKYSNGEWHFINCTPNSLYKMVESGAIMQIYFDPAKPHLMNDTMRVVQNVDSVLNGEAPLQMAFTGQDVIIGYVDSGIDYLHEDFKNEDGSSRVLYYWDHTLAIDPERTPEKYGYGQVWTNEDIDAGICESGDASAHGTTVVGAGSGNGRATGSHKGVAPNSDIIMVETNFALPNWTLSVADAVDFIFSMADTLGKPAVINTSVGSYLGSHDGTDPASQIIDSLLNDKPGRILVAAAGNSGAQGKYHLKGFVDEDTSFTWFDVNPASAFDVPATYFDLWADTLDFKNVEFAFGADRVSPSFQFRGRTDFYTIEALLGITTYDTIWVDGNAISPVEFYAEEINGVYHIEMVMLDPDSADYYFRLETTGNGSFDLWSGAWIGVSNIVFEGLPDIGSFPEIIHYMYPDSLSTIVTSWTCSPYVVTVGNFKNQYDYIDYLGDPYIVSGGPPGELSPNSSKGPNRHGYMKPDVSATGDGIMSASPIWLSDYLKVANPTMLAEGGQHVRNGGTSMASPVIAGIAALYLEKCPNATCQDFLDDLHTFAYEDMYTALTPNTGYGYGKVDAFQLLIQTNFPVTLIGDTLICDAPEVYSVAESPFDSYAWFNGATDEEINLSETAQVYTIVTNAQGCLGYSDTISVIKGTLPLFPNINEVGGGLISTPAAHYIWYVNGVPIEDSDSQFFDPESTGTYTVQVFSEEGCSYFSDEIFVELSEIEEMSKDDFILFPNPFVETINIIKSDYSDLSVYITDVSGKAIYSDNTITENQLFIQIDLSHVEGGIYIVNIFYDDSFSSYKVVKQ